LVTDTLSVTILETKNVTEKVSVTNKGGLKFLLSTEETQCF
jgi:hypothetical protein